MWVWNSHGGEDPGVLRILSVCCRCGVHPDGLLANFARVEARVPLNPGWAPRHGYEFVCEGTCQGPKRLVMMKS